MVSSRSRRRAKSHQVPCSVATLAEGLLGQFIFDVLRKTLLNYFFFVLKCVKSFGMWGGGIQSWVIVRALFHC